MVSLEKKQTRRPQGPRPSPTRESRIDVSILLTSRVKRARTLGRTTVRTRRFYAQRALVATRRVRHEFRDHLRAWPSALSWGAALAPESAVDAQVSGHSFASALDAGQPQWGEGPSLGRAWLEPARRATH